jgi:hypothetical protein
MHDKTTASRAEAAKTNAASAPVLNGVDAQRVNEQELREAVAGKEAKPFAPDGDEVWAAGADDSQLPAEGKVPDRDALRRNAGREAASGEPSSE